MVAPHLLIAALYYQSTPLGLFDVKEEIVILNLAPVLQGI